MRNEISYLAVGVTSAIVIPLMILSMIFDGYIWDIIGFGSVIISFIIFKIFRAEKAFSGTLQDTDKLAVLVVSIGFVLVAVCFSLFITGIYSESAAADLMVRLLMIWLYICLLIHSTLCYLKEKRW